MKNVLRTLIAIFILTHYWKAWGDSVPERFERGKIEFEQKNFGNAIKNLRPILYPVVQLKREEDIVKAREMLGLAYFYTGEEGKAKEEFTRLLYLRPWHRLDPFLIPPAAIGLFDKIWQDPQMKAKLEKIEKERLEKERNSTQKKDPPKTETKKIYMHRDEVQNSRWLTFLPFGAGQFQNGDTTKGIILASTSGISLATNITCYSLLLALANEDGRYAQSDLSLAKGLKVAQYVSLGIFLAGWIYGSVDANLYYQPVVYGPFRQMTPEKELNSNEDSWFLPVVAPHGLGIRFETRF